MLGLTSSSGASCGRSLNHPIHRRHVRRSRRCPPGNGQRQPRDRLGRSVWRGTGTVGDEQIEAAIGRIDKLGRLTPRGIRTHLGLNKPIYQATAAYGHFGRKPEGDLFPWEGLDLAEDRKAAIAA